MFSHHFQPNPNSLISSSIFPNNLIYPNNQQQCWTLLHEKVFSISYLIVVVMARVMGVMAITTMLCMQHCQHHQKQKLKAANIWHLWNL
eukprot:2575658-Ditylum_brightwellii.AAC.1